MRDDTSARRTLREIRFQRIFRHENVMSLYDLHIVPSERVLYIVMPMMDTDLSRVIRSTQPLSPLHVQYFTEQLLDGLAYLHECCNCMHRDLKPANLLVNESCELRITDFGLARVDPSGDCLDGATFENRMDLTSYVVTRWYRAPELVLCSGRYGKAVDMWSVGCILAELCKRKPLFPGKSHVDQLDRIIDVMGSPEPSALHSVPPSAQRYLASLPRVAPQHLSGLFPDAGEEVLSLLMGLLSWDPSRRATVREALSHPYLSAIAPPEWDSNRCVSITDDDEGEGEGEGEWTDSLGALWREVTSFQAERGRQVAPYPAHIGRPEGEEALPRQPAEATATATSTAAAAAAAAAAAEAAAAAAADKAGRSGTEPQPLPHKGGGFATQLQRSAVAPVAEVAVEDVRTKSAERRGCGEKTQGATVACGMCADDDLPAVYRLLASRTSTGTAPTSSKPPAIRSGGGVGSKMGASVPSQMASGQPRRGRLSHFAQPTAGTNALWPPAVA